MEMPEGCHAMTKTAQQLREIIDAVYPRLMSIPESRASEKPYPEKWSIKEILGHLIDSAANNHQRIVRMQEKENIGYFSYPQDLWVTLQGYQAEDWTSLVELWHQHNNHLAHIIGSIRDESLAHVCDIGYSKPATLRFIVEDYIRHVQHHTDQILTDLDPRKRKPWVPRSPSANRQSK